MAKHKRAEGGKADTSDKEWDSERGEDVRDSAPEARDNARKVEGEAKERKRGGKADKRETEKRHERDERKRGGATRKVDGEASRPRLDRAKRKSGGGVGADHNPLSSASRTTERRDSGSMERKSGGED